MNSRGSDEHSHLLRSVLRSSELSDIGELEIVAYVQNRRASIASVGTNKIPRHFALQPKPSGANLAESLYRVRSNVSAYTHHTDINDILSVHSGAILKEPETSLANEARVLMRYSVPLVITFLLQYSLTVASVFSVGRLGLTALAAVSLSSMTANISGYAIIQGVSTCLDTLCAQAYGRQDYNTVGLHFVRCTYLLMLLYVPMLVLWVFLSRPVLSFLVGPDKTELAYLASSYLQVLALGLPGFIIFENLKHFLQAQGIFHASTYVLLFCAPLNALLNYLLVWDRRVGLGFIGAPLSVVITNWLMCIMLLAYTLYVNGYQCLPREPLFDSTFFRNWTKIINLSVPGVLMVEAEWLAFEIITFTASTFGTDVLAAQSIVSTTCVLLYQIPFALSIAASTRIAWFIGAASKKAAVTASQAAMYCALALGSCNAVVLFSFRTFFASLYTSDKKVLDIASTVLIIGSVYQINDFLACVSGGILRGQGRQKIGGILNLVSYYLIALPCAFFFAFYFKWELVGLWLGMIIALFFVSVLQTYFVYVSDWDHIIKECINEGILEDGNLNIDAHSTVPAMLSNFLI
ncbi:MATE efflux family protein [Metschnikowia bicuspidata var. bicuspidata NRRL YB-4993]|uniref:MATE efflux family protein n=1 Tax=Metschnikowia bicuspidata var. bicuspidata NRRL YB-4993 TaxID=869754 RepID=A0A1A0HDX5_9ASCO|nr:MATE efflux family protein [Metschnikowia bicuspidata var. bicuspidata NRRL YB-4993]OBA22108.1 MATE efflux family protein [Metschnikowia bicuspidata var. bicuspidata NRRL YB-4993]